MCKNIVILLLFLFTGFSFAAEKAIDFTLPDLKGNAVTLSKYKGKVVFLNFWATWCPPCREEMPSMQALYGKLKSSDFEMLAVSIDRNKLTVEKFIRANKYSFPVLLNPKGQVAAIYNVYGIPATFIINKKGEVAMKEVGSRDWIDKIIVSKLKKLIAE